MNEEAGSYRGEGSGYEELGSKESGRKSGCLAFDLHLGTPVLSVCSLRRSHLLLPFSPHSKQTQEHVGE